MTACRACSAELSTIAADLGMSPLSNAYLTAAELDQMEPFYPLLALVCDSCLLVQLAAYESPARIFSDYAYFSSYSTSWLAHCEAYVDAVVERLGLGTDSHVVEIASNDGYLLQYFQKKGIPALGVEPAENVAETARAKGIPTVTEFFGQGTAGQLVADAGMADLVIANNVLAHVPDLNDFIAGLALLVAPTGTITIEFPHLLTLVEQRQFDTIYHEHFSYFSLMTVQRAFAAHGLVVYDVEEIPTHGGSLRIWASRGPQIASDRVEAVIARERVARLHDVRRFEEFAAEVVVEKRRIVAFFHAAKERGDRIVGYGAPAKGNTLLNYCGLGRDVLDFTVDRSPHKQGLYLPGTHIPVLAPGEIDRARPDLVFILPWNLREEIEAQLQDVRGWGGRFVARSPELRIS